MSEALNFAAAAAVMTLFLGAGLAAQTDKPADEEGHKLLVKVCGSCHKVDIVTSRRGTRRREKVRGEEGQDCLLILQPRMNANQRE
jgi:cytochrome c5